MKDDRLTLSPKHGVNPSFIKCWICGEGAGIALLGRLKDDAEAPRTCVTGEVCRECENKMRTRTLIRKIKDDTFTGIYIWINKKCIDKSMREHKILNMMADEFEALFECDKAESDRSDSEGSV